MGVESMGGYDPTKEDSESTEASKPKTTRRGFLKFLGGAAATGMALTRGGDKIEHTARELTGEAVDRVETAIGSKDSPEAPDNNSGDSRPSITPERGTGINPVESLSAEVGGERRQPGNFDEARKEPEAQPGA
jgi:hypothetical protein